MQLFGAMATILSFPVNRFTHSAVCSEIGPQPWLETHPALFICQCTCPACQATVWAPECGPWRGFCVAVPRNKAEHLYIRAPIGTCPNDPGRELFWGDVAALGFYDTVVLLLVETVRGDHKVGGG